MSKVNNRHLLAIAKESAHLAGKNLIENKIQGKKINADLGKDIKLEADVQSEKIIIDSLSANSKFSILSEEKGLIKGENDSLIWIVDPLDGTMNYLQDIPFCCVSIGLWCGNDPVLGVIYDFNRNETFSGIVGEGAWVNDSELRVSSVNQVEKAVLCTGFPVNSDFSDQGVKDFISSATAYKKVRLLGSAALCIAYVAAGRMDVYKENGIMFWDIAGGLAVLSAARGKYKIKKLSKKDSYRIYASNGKI